MNAPRTSSTGPHVCGMTWIPAEANMFSSREEIPPQISTSTPSFLMASARLAGAERSSVCSSR